MDIVEVYNEILEVKWMLEDCVMALHNGTSDESLGYYPEHLSVLKTLDFQAITKLENILENFEFEEE